MTHDQDYCGCCGDETRGAFFCVKCTKIVKHLGPSSLHLWDRTYEAVHGEPCPFSLPTALTIMDSFSSKFFSPDAEFPEVTPRDAAPLDPAMFRQLDS
jgi:hypothetical protein